MMMRNRLFSSVGLFALAALGGCSEPAETDARETITAEELTRHTRTLSSDRFLGRAPEGPGEEKTVSYLIEQFKSAGLHPGNGDSWVQEVPLVSITAEPDANLEVSGEDASETFEYGSEAMLWTRRLEEEVTLNDSELVFVGYGIRAPEYDWNDYAGVDVEGKTVVMLVNDPGFATQDPELFNGNAMTYYGRWTYKYEEAARQGAAGAIIIHEEKPAGYPWAVVEGGWSGKQFHLADRGDEAFTKIEGWVTREAADRLFDAAGMDLEALKQQAEQPGFEARPMNLRAGTRITNRLERSSSNNVLAKIPGTKRPDETVIFMGHWDHLGQDPSLEGDQIYNGAVDNATGIAALLELAEAFAQSDPQPERTVVFMPVTAEEQGLLGSKYYTQNPVYPLDKTAAAINIDGLNVYGPTRDITIIGKGQSELEEYLAAAAREQERTVRPDPHAEKGYFYRSDHFNFAKKGVPALYTDPGIEHLEKGADYMKRKQDEYTAERYHKPSDEFDPDWDWRGAVQDVRLFYRVGHRLAMESSFPRWYEGSEFRSAREKDRSTAGDRP